MGSDFYLVRQLATRGQVTRYRLVVGGVLFKLVTTLMRIVHEDKLAQVLAQHIDLTNEIRITADQQKRIPSASTCKAPIARRPMYTKRNSNPPNVLLLNHAVPPYGAASRNGIDFGSSSYFHTAEQYQCGRLACCPLRLSP